MQRSQRRRRRAIAATTSVVGFALAAHAAHAAPVVSNYDDLTEGFYGQTYTYNGVTYHDVNNVTGAFPDGTPMTPADLGTNLVVEEADYLYDSMPDFGSRNNALTFGQTFINGPNLSIGPLASVWMDLGAPAAAASFDIAFYENGPWGGIQYHLDALSNHQVVDSDVFSISDLGGRDNPTFVTMDVTAAAFDQLHLYATLNGQYTAPRGIIDDLSIMATPEPASCAIIVSVGAMVLMRARRERRG